MFDQIIRELEGLDSKISEEDKICHLLLSLNEEYEYVITAIETLNTDINLEFVKARLLDEELKIKNKCTEMSFKANSQFYNNNSNYNTYNNYNRRSRRYRGRSVNRFQRG